MGRATLDSFTPSSASAIALTATISTPQHLAIDAGEQGKLAAATAAAEMYGARSVSVSPYP
jgi:hypothetical protein